MACAQSCGWNPNSPELVNGFIYNWVEGIFDEDKNELVHFVRTCRTWCKYNGDPPLCPPGFCANVNCDVCLPGEFANAELDAAASLAETEMDNKSFLEILIGMIFFCF